MKSTSRRKAHLRWLPLVLLVSAYAISTTPAESQSSVPPYQDPSLPVEQRVDDLVGRMTLEEKVSQMVNNAPAIERLGIPKYNWWNECLHGVARAGFATVFPQAIGLGATWDTELVHSMADVTSTEARAKYHEAIRHNVREIYRGLTFWSPNINIFRDPRWGRGQETYGEDPYLTSRIGVAFVKGLQGDDPRYLKVVSTPKHFAVHSGPEPARHAFDAHPSERDLRETYLPAFEALIREGKAFSIMGAYNAVDGQTCCASPRLLDEFLRKQWGFEGYVVSDCGAVGDIFFGHHLAKSLEEASAMAVKAGTDLDCGNEYRTLVKAVKDGLIGEAEINRAVKRLFGARFRLGMFDPPEMVPYSKIPFSENDSPAHRQLALEAARKSIVLLKNDNQLLPLNKSLKSIAVIGPNADVVKVLLGNYNGMPSKAVTPLEGIKSKVSADTKVLYARGADWAKPSADSVLLDEATGIARQAEVVIMTLGLSPDLEGEEMRVNLEGFKGGDRTSLDLPRVQQQLLEAVYATGKPVVLVLLSGSAVSVTWADQHVPAIVEAWYPGEEGGTAIADVLFGDYSPAGRLPVTFYRSEDDLPPFEDYNMASRTYRYFKGAPLYPFGHGLNYSKFSYSKLRISSEKVKVGQSQQVTVEVRNAGQMAGDEVVELYVSHVNATVPVPIRALAGFTRVHLAAGEAKRVAFTLAPRQLSEIDDLGRRVVEPGRFRIEVGGKQPGFTGTADSPTTEVVTKEFTVTGKLTPGD